jgi:aminoglycoside 6-adenylyltransferase
MLATIVEWATRQEDVVAAVMTGSRARGGGAVDEFSDYDVELFTTEVDKYLANPDWFAAIGDVWVWLRATDEGYPHPLVFFDGGEKVDFGIYPVSVLERQVDRGLNELYERGYRVLLDKSGLASRLPEPSRSPPARALPTDEEYRAVNVEFWFEAAHIPRYLRRGDLWVVKHRDWTMKEMLLRMLEWQAIATDGGRHDVWHIGTKMRTWVPPAVWRRLDEVFGRFAADDSWRALLATMSLFREVSFDVAERLGYRYPAGIDDAITAYVLGFDGDF